MVPSALQHKTFNHYYPFSPIIDQHILTAQALRRKAWTYQTECLGKTFLPELEEERIVIGCLAVNGILRFARRRQWVGSLHSFTIYLRRWIIPEHTTDIGKPFPYFAAELMIHSTLFGWSPRPGNRSAAVSSCESAGLSTSGMKVLNL